MSTGDALRVISKTEVAEHNKASSNWIIIDNLVYDVTRFLSEHPGGEEVLLEQAGKDATSSFYDVGHSADAKEMTKEYVIGKLQPQQEVKKSDASSEPVATASSGASLKDIILSPTWTNFIIPSAIGIVVYIVYKGVARLLV